MPSRIGESEGVEEGPSGSTWDCVAFSLITPGLIAKKISKSGGSVKAKARELSNKCVCACLYWGRSL